MISIMVVIFFIAFIALLLFAYFRNRQAKRNDARRERLWQKQEELMEMLEKKVEPGSNNED